MPDKVAAMEKIRNGDFEIGFEELSKAFQKTGADETIINDLQKCFFEPNSVQMEENFQDNSKLLMDYPYFFSKRFLKPNENRYMLLPINESIYYCYDRIDQRLIPMEINSEHETKYFFNNIDNPLFVENEFNEFNLKFLEDNIRDSTDFAGDNHIYLAYENEDLFSLLLYYCDLSSLLKRRKIVFLIGNERTKYPIDFKKEFGIDYNSLAPQKIRIEEMNRICYWLKRGYSGSSFVLGVLHQNKYLSSNEAANAFYNGTKYKGVELRFLEPFTKLIQDTKTEYSFDFLMKWIKKPALEFNDLRISSNSAVVKKVNIKILCWIKDHSKKNKFTIPELLRGFMLYWYYEKESNMNPRIVPVIVFEPHWNNYSHWAQVVLSFPYRKALNCIRDQIITCGQILKQEKSIFIYGDYGIQMGIPQAFRSIYRVVKFEDLKLYPVETSKALCEYLCIPYDPQMVADTAISPLESKDAEKPKTMFDKTTLHRNVDDVLSKFDQVRLQIFYDPILRHYGYPAFDFESCPMTNDDVAFLLKFPFKFEKGYVENGKWEKVTAKQLRQRLYSNMVKIYLAAKRGEFLFPPVIRPKLEGKKEENK